MNESWSHVTQLWTPPWTEHYFTDQHGEPLDVADEVGDGVPRPRLEPAPHYEWQGDWIVSEAEYAVRWGGPWISEEEQITQAFSRRRKLYIRVQVPVDECEGHRMMGAGSGVELRDIEHIEA